MGSRERGTHHDDLVDLVRDKWGGLAVLGVGVAIHDLDTVRGKERRGQGGQGVVRSTEGV